MDAPNNEMAREKVGQIPLEVVISQLITYLGVQEEVQKEFRDKILEWLKKNEFSVRKKVLPVWAHVAQDFNKAHIYNHYAKKEGFKTTPVHGTLISAYYEDYILDFLGIVNDFSRDGKKLVYNSQRLKIGKPLYPYIRWSKRKNKFVLENLVCVRTNGNKEGIDLIISVVDPRRKPEEQMIIRDAKASFRYLKNEANPEYINSFLSAGDIVEKSNIEFTDDELNDFYKCLNRKPREIFPMMYFAALGISTVLKLASKETGKPKGAYRQMSLKFYNYPPLPKGSESIFKTVLRMPSAPKHIKDEDTQEEGYVYMFKALTLQDGKVPISEGTFFCFSKDKFILN